MVGTTGVGRIVTGLQYDVDIDLGNHDTHPKDVKRQVRAVEHHGVLRDGHVSAERGQRGDARVVALAAP